MTHRQAHKHPWHAPAALVLVGLLAFSQVSADTLRVAVASNFAAAMKDIAARFEASSGHRLSLVYGSTGKHYAQIINGAPFQAFFAADVKRPRLLEEQNLIVPGSRFSYALGKLVLWSPRAGYVDSEGRVLASGDFRHLALANPRLAPYGRAARQVLQTLGLWEGLGPRLVRGENIAQAYQFVGSGNAELGFVAYSQISGNDRTAAGSFWKIPDSLYEPIDQQAVLLEDSPAAQALMTYMRRDDTRRIIRDAGYGLP